MSFYGAREGILLGNERLHRHENAEEDLQVQRYDTNIASISFGQLMSFLRENVWNICLLRISLAESAGFLFYRRF